MAAPGTFGAERYLTRRWPYNDQSIRYVRSATGNDNNDGLTPATAWQTLDRGLQSFAIAGVNKIWTLDIAGTFADATRPLNIGGTMLGGLDSDLDFLATAPGNFIGRNHCQLVSEPVAVLSPLTITLAAAGATTGLYTITVAEVLVPGAHAGQILIGDGLVEYARILSNTANQIFVMTRVNPTTWTAPVGIFQAGATIQYGDPGNFFEQATYLIALTDWFFSGISFQSTADSKQSSLNIIANAPIFFQMCDFAGIYLQGGSDLVTFDACDVHDHFFGHDGPALAYRTSTIRNLGFRFHGSSASGNTTFSDLGVTGCTNALGAGNSESRYSFAVVSGHFEGNADDAINCRFGNNSITNTLLQANGKDGLLATGPSTLVRMTNVDGTLNAGHGVLVRNGAQVDADAATTVTGGVGDISVGAAGTFAWAALPVVDLGAQLCSAY